MLSERSRVYACGEICDIEDTETTEYETTEITESETTESETAQQSESNVIEPNRQEENKSGCGDLSGVLLQCLLHSLV